MDKRSLNKNLHRANKAKKDEFYTSLEDIEKELKYYKDHFKGKVVYCNCDDPYESNFFKYFATNFNALGLKKLITTSYNPSPIAGEDLPLLKIAGMAENKENTKKAMKIEINEVPDADKNGAIDLADVKFLLENDKNLATPLKGNGDFRSKECIELLKKADIVCTNPPFSLFREYVAQLIEYNKKFLIIGNTNALTYKEIFNLIKENKIRTGYTNFNVGMFFVVPDYWTHFHHVDDKGRKIARVSTSCWFTNMEVKKHKEFLTLYKKYNPKDYPKYDNFNAINVNKYIDIPYDYDGYIGVPITFIDKYNPDQFEIIRFRKGDDNKDLSINGKYTYFRVIIRNKKVKK